MKTYMVIDTMAKFCVTSTINLEEANKTATMLRGKGRMVKVATDSEWTKELKTLYPTSREWVTR